MAMVVSISRLPVGSSAKITDGPIANALAILMRCASPPDSCAGNKWAFSVSCTNLRRSVTRSSITACDLPTIPKGSAMFSQTFISGISR